MLLYIAYSLCPAHGTNVLRQKFRYYFITSNGIIIPIQNLIDPVHILKYSAMQFCISFFEHDNEHFDP